MKRCNFYLPNSLVAKLKAEAKESELSMSELLRSAILYFLRRKKIRERETPIERNRQVAMSRQTCS